MPATLDDRLRALGDDLLAATSPISRDDIATVAVVATDAPRHRPRWPAAAALAAAAAVIAVVVVATRSDDDHRSIGAPSVDGRLLLDPLPDGWELTGIGDGALTDRAARAHLYERTSEAPAQLAVRVFDARWNAPYVPDQHESVTVAGYAASIYDDDDIAGRRAVSYEVDRSWVVITATGITDAELLSLAAAVTIDDSSSGSIAPSALPTGFADLGMAWRQMTGFVTDTAGLNAGPRVSWRRGQDSFSYFSVPGGASAQLLTFFATTVDPVRVRGVDASLITVPNGPDFLALVWVESGRTYFANGYQVDRGELIDMVDSLDAATDEEWDRAIASLVPPVATIDPQTGVPSPGSVIPTKVTQFPTLPADALSTLGNPTPFAQYLYYSAGVDQPGSLWEGAIGPDDPTSSAADIVITVADLGNAETPPADPGRTPTITEREYGTGLELYTTRDGYQIVLRGTDKDLMYVVIELVQPLVNNGELAGYGFSGALPTGLVETAAPNRHGFESGSFPALDFNGGAARIQVRPEPLANALADELADFTTYESTLGTVFVMRSTSSEAPLGYWVRAHVELSDGSTLTLETSWLTVDEVIALIDSIQLVTQQEWDDRYGPMPAIIPFIGATGSDTPVTTAAAANG